MPKEPPLLPSIPDLAIHGDHVDLRPGGFEEPSSSTEDTSTSTERALMKHTSKFRESPLAFLHEVSLHISGSGWRSYDEIIGQPVFFPGFSERMKNMVLEKDMLKSKVEELAQGRIREEVKLGLLSAGNSMDSGSQRKRKEEILKALWEYTDATVDNMICKMESKLFIRGASYLATQAVTRAYHQGIHVSSEEVLRLRAVAKECETKKQSIIFLPCHRSHIDYISLQVICFRLGISLPTVVAGDNLAFIGLKEFLQHAGAMWIRRSFAGDVLYTTIVQTYMDTLIQEGFNVECFIEGGRSRTGKLLPPKFGILSFLMDTVASGRCEDAIICPVSTQYDKVIETESYISELLGQPKKKENIMDFLASSSVLSLKLGRVDVRFHEPWSLKDFIATQTSRMARIPQQLEQTDVKSKNRLRLLRAMGYKVMSDINAVSVVMPTALVGTVLLTLRGRGVGKSELIRRVGWLTDRVKAKGGRVAHLHGIPMTDVVDRALEVLGPGLVGRVEGLAEETYYAVDRFQLSFYRNMTIHLFISEALVCAALYTRVKMGGGPEHQRIPFQELYGQVDFLSRIFRGEFIYKTEGLALNLGKTLNGLEADSIISIERQGTQMITIELSEIERHRGRENFDFYLFEIFPFVEALWLGAVSLFSLTPPPGQPDAQLELNKVQEMAQLFGKTLYHQGDLSYFEAVNKETLKNAYSRFEVEGILIISKSKDPKSSALARLHPDWRPARDSQGHLIPQGRLWDYTELISKSRREGKNRRDGATVSDRVLKLAEKCGMALFKRAAEESGSKGTRGKDSTLHARL